MKREGKRRGFMGSTLNGSEILGIFLSGMAIILIIINIFLNFKNSSNKDNNAKLEELRSKLELLRSDINRTEIGVNRIEGSVREEISRNREEFGKSREEMSRLLKENREETATNFKSFGEIISNNLENFSKQLQNLNKINEEKYKSLEDHSVNHARENRAEVMKLNVSIEEKLEKIRETMENKLKTLQDENSKKLEEMRVTVDEKLQASVEKRFNDSFKMISERLDQVHKGLGEMQTLANGVGDLKKVLTNVKTRGTLGEIQLGSILEQILSPEQYESNAVTKPNSNERVEFAVKLPGRNMDDEAVLLPIDSKFPIEDYQRLQDAYDRSPELTNIEIESCAKQFENAVKKSAKDIRDKYINPPHTTDFAILFVPTEGLYAEILRRSGLFEYLQRDLKISVVGPSNLVAFLSSLQMGFRTLAIEKRSSEVWDLLGAVKTEFGKFGDVLDKTKKKLEQAVDAIGSAGTKSRAIERKLRNVAEMPREQSKKLLGEILAEDEDAEEALNNSDGEFNDN